MYQAYFDLNSYANVFGGVATSLERGSDCPDHATYFDAVVSTESGRPTLTPRAACLFERVTGDPAWRHTGDGVVESRVRRDLVLRMSLRRATTTICSTTSSCKMARCECAWARREWIKCAL